MVDVLEAGVLGEDFVAGAFAGAAFAGAALDAVALVAVLVDADFAATFVAEGTAFAGAVSGVAAFAVGTFTLCMDGPFFSSTGVAYFFKIY